MEMGSEKIILSKKVKILANILLSIVAFFIIWQGLSKVFAQMPPPGTTICAVFPNLCPPGGGGATAGVDLWANTSAGEVGKGGNTPAGDIGQTESITLFWDKTSSVLLVSCDIINSATGEIIPSAGTNTNPGLPVSPNGDTTYTASCKDQSNNPAQDAMAINVLAPVLSKTIVDPNGNPINGTIYAKPGDTINYKIKYNIKF